MRCGDNEEQRGDTQTPASTAAGGGRKEDARDLDTAVWKAL